MRLTVEPLGETLEVQEGQSILEAGRRAGVWLPHACCHGPCSTCKVQVLQGEVDHGDASPFALLDTEREEGQALACCARLKSDATIEADLELDPDARPSPVRDHVGRVARLEDLSPNVKGVWLEVETPGFEFQAGQYVNLTLPGVEGPRAFSLANAPSSPALLELHVKRVPGGAGTGYVHERLAVGDRLPFAGPYGRFFVRKSSEKPLLFLAGGSGLSAVKSMVLDLAGEGFPRQVELIHGVCDRPDLYFADLFRELAASSGGRFTYVPALSSPGAGTAWDGEVGFVHEVLGRRHERCAGMRAYLCGPPPMIEACIRLLMKGRLFERDIFTEKFVTARDGRAALARSPLFKRI